MMQLLYSELETPLIFEETYVPTLVVENQLFLRKIVTDLYSQTKGGSGKWVLSKDFVPLDFAKTVIIVNMGMPFDGDTKLLISKINANLEKLSMDESHFVATQQLIGTLQRYAQDLLFDIPFDLQSSTITTAGLIKLFSVHMCDDYSNDLEKLLDYMQLLRYFDTERLFVLLQSRSFYQDNEISMFLQSVIANRIQVLLIDSVDYPRLDYEKRKIVDSDLCEIE